MTVKPCKYGCKTMIYWNTNENAFFEAETELKHNCPNYKKTETFTQTLNKLEEKPIISNDKILDEIKALTELVKKQCQLFEAILINQGLYKPASDLE